MYKGTLPLPLSRNQQPFKKIFKVTIFHIKKTEMRRAEKLQATPSWPHPPLSMDMAVPLFKPRQSTPGRAQVLSDRRGWPGDFVWGQVEETTGRDGHQMPQWPIPYSGGSQFRVIFASQGVVLPSLKGDTLRCHNWGGAAGI